MMMKKRSRIGTALVAGLLSAILAVSVTGMTVSAAWDRPFLDLWKSVGIGIILMRPGRN